MILFGDNLPYLLLTNRLTERVAEQQIETDLLYTHTLGIEGEAGEEIVNNELLNR
jgi:hypothetical protein